MATKSFIQFHATYLNHNYSNPITELKHIWTNKDSDWKGNRRRLGSHALCHNKEF